MTVSGGSIVLIFLDEKHKGAFALQSSSHLFGKNGSVFAYNTFDSIMFHYL